jgi:hypothetical protein
MGGALRSWLNKGRVRSVRLYAAQGFITRRWLLGWAENHKERVFPGCLCPLIEWAVQHGALFGWRHFGQWPTTRLSTKVKPVACRGAGRCFVAEA